MKMVSDVYRKCSIHDASTLLTCWKWLIKDSVVSYMLRASVAVPHRDKRRRLPSGGFSFSSAIIYTHFKVPIFSNYSI
jgi:hypothetical protein